MYNLGFIGIGHRESSRKLLKWWKYKLSKHCIKDFYRGLYVDQKYIDLAPLFFSGIQVLTHPGCNVSYWNLHERNLAQNGGNWFVDSEKLIFYHFSSFRPDKKSVLSPFCTRYNFHNKKEIAPLFLDYARELFESNFDTSRNWLYSFCVFQDGNPIPDRLRKLYHYRSLQGEILNNPFASKLAMESFLGLQDVVPSNKELKTFLRLCTPPFLWNKIRKIKYLFRQNNT
jgi:hypothetical protein